jgi:predicted amidohydrolase
MSKHPKIKQMNITSMQAQHATKKCNQKVQNVNSWDSAIRKAKHKIARLKADILVFQEMKDSGEAWPGEQLAGQKGQQQHSV